MISKMNKSFGGVGKEVKIAVASGAILVIGGTAVAICSTAMGSTNWSSIFAAGCGAGIYFQSLLTAKLKQEEMDRKTSEEMKTIYDFVSAFFGSQALRPDNKDVDTFSILLEDYLNKTEWALSEACFWNEVENLPKKLTKEHLFFAKMDRELHYKLKHLLNTKPNIEGGSLIIEESDMFERIDELLLIHKARCIQGLETLEQEYQFNAQLVVYLENNEPKIDIGKYSPIKQFISLGSGYNRDTCYPRVRHSVELPPSDSSPLVSPSPRLMHPDSPGRSNDINYPRYRRRSSSSRRDSPHQS